MARLSRETRDLVRAGAIASARACWPFIADACWTDTILDVGAGEGHWGAAARRLLQPEPLTLDVDLPEWDAETLAPLPLPPGFADRWAVALCLEMAEHVSPAAGDHLVAELTRVAGAVVWSAAIPGQGGDGHVNEQWPSYWHERFARHGWRLHDPFRDALWARGDVEPWYAQNMLLAEPVGHGGAAGQPPRHLVHPAVFETALRSAAYWRQAYHDHLTGGA